MRFAFSTANATKYAHSFHIKQTHYGARVLNCVLLYKTTSYLNTMNYSYNYRLLLFYLLSLAKRQSAAFGSATQQPLEFGGNWGSILLLLHTGYSVKATGFEPLPMEDLKLVL